MSRKADAETDSSSARSPLNEISLNGSTPFPHSNSAVSTSNGALTDPSASTTSLRKTARSAPPASNDDKTAVITDPILPLAHINGHTQATKPQEPQYNAHNRGSRNLVMSFFRESIPSFLAVSVMLSLIFGGCCSNVFALEAIIKPNPDSGTLLTFVQFLFIASIGYVSHFDFSAGPTRLFLKQNRVPLRRWLVNIALFFTINVLNNHAFSYNISVPIHIILRSGGSITTIAVGYLWGKRFSRTQITSVLLLTVGVITAAWSDQQNKSAEQLAGKAPPAGEAQRPSFSYGLAVLFFAQVLSAVMGIYTEETYRQYGPQWKENLFYSHFVALPLFIPFIPSMATQFSRMAKSEPLYLPWQGGYFKEGVDAWGEGLPGVVRTLMGWQVPSQLAYMALNVLTQYACIRGVNLLASTSSALTVTIVLNVRKLVSLLLSIWLFGNTLSPGTIIGAGIVFTSGGMYSLDRTKPKARRGRPRAQTGTQLKEMKELNGEGKVG